MLCYQALPVGKAGVDSGLDWTKIWTRLDWTFLFRGVIFFGGGVGGGCVIFLVYKKIAFSTFPQQAIFFHLWGGGRRVVLYRLYFSFGLSFSLRLVALFDSWPSCFT